MGLFKKAEIVRPSKAPDKFMDDRQSAYDLGEWELRTSHQQLEDFHSSFNIFETDKKLIRVGAEGDGGYLIPDDLEGIRAVFSPGVDAVAEFESYFAERGIDCYLADASVESPPISHPNFHFQKKFVYAGPSQGTWLNFQNWIEQSAPPEGDLLLQMDIEGAEWEILEEIPMDLLNRFRIIVLEMHGMHQLAYKIAYETIKRTFQKLTLNFEIVHIHPNNAERTMHVHGFELAPLLEVSLLRKDRISSKYLVEKLPNKLDRDNVSFYPSTHLDNRWLKSNELN